MSAIKAKLQEDIKVAMRDRDKDRLLTLRGLHAALKQVEIDTRKELDDPIVVDIVRKEIKKRRDSIEFAEKSQRDDLVQKDKAEIALLQGYLGEQISEDKLEAVIKEIIASGADNIGKIMGALNSQHKGKFEGKVASELIKKLLS